MSNLQYTYLYFPELIFYILCTSLDLKLISFRHSFIVKIESKYLHRSEQYFLFFSNSFSLNVETIYMEIELSACCRLMKAFSHQTLPSEQTKLARKFKFTLHLQK